MNYRKKPIVIQAVRFFDTAESLCEISEFVDKDINVKYQSVNDPKLAIETLEGVMEASVGDYIIRGVNGEFYPCKPDIFEKTYDSVELDSPKKPNVDRESVRRKMILQDEVTGKAFEIDLMNQVNVFVTNTEGVAVFGCLITANNLVKYLKKGIELEIQN